MEYTADLAIPDYTATGTPNQDQKAWLYRPDGTGPFPLLVEIPDLGNAVGPTMEESAGLAYLARAEGLAVLRLAYTQPARGIFDGDDDHDHPARDVRWAVQRARLEASTWRIDPNRIVLWGRGLGAFAASPTAFGPDAADAGGGAQNQQSSRVLGAILERPVALWSAMVQATTPAYPYFSATTTAKLSTIDPGVQDAASPLLLVDDPRNAGLRYHGLYLGATESQVYAAPYPDDELLELGSGWHSEVLASRMRLQGETRYWVSTIDLGVPGQQITASELKVLGWLLWTVGRLPVEELVLRALESRLRDIRHANGFGVDVLRVERHEDLGVTRVYPSIVVVGLGGAYDDASFSTKSHNRLRVGLSLVQAGTQRWQERASIFLAAVRRALDYSPSLVARPRGTGSPLNVHILESRRFIDTLGGVERSGVVCEAEVVWRDELGDPYTELG